jgi:alcohol dehydrogenase YqhD (iron-dependent ADH family)
VQAFELCIPTRIIFGEGTVNNLGDVVKQFGSNAFLVTYDKSFMKKIGIYQKVLNSLNNAGIKVTEHFGVKSNPSIEDARKAIKVVKKSKPDVIIAVGGGSVIDEAKAIGIGACSKDDIWDLVTGKAEIKASLPVVTVVTIPATSSEMNATCVMTNEKLKRKEGFGNPLMYPKVSILDPQLTYTIPLKQTAYSATDIISHIFEGYLAHNDSFVPMQNRYCENIIKTTIECMNKLLKNPKDAQSRAMIMWTATYSWNGFYVCGLGRFDNPIHILGHSFSAFYELPHGAAMSITILATMRYHLNEKKSRYAQLARQVFEVCEEDDLKAAKQGIKLLEKWFKKIGTPTNFKEANMPENELAKLADDALLTAKMWGLEDLWNKERALDMLKLCI